MSHVFLAVFRAYRFAVFLKYRLSVCQLTKIQVTFMSLKPNTGNLYA